MFPNSVQHKHFLLHFKCRSFKTKTILLHVSCVIIDREINCPLIDQRAACLTLLQSSIRISMTMFWNLISNMAATVSSSALMRVGPNITPILDIVIRFSLLWLQTLKKHTHRRDNAVRFGTRYRDCACYVYCTCLDTTNT